MRRISISPRTGWTKKVEQLGFLYHSLDSIYWDERACYALRMNEVLQLERATAELHQMCLQAAQYIIDRKLYSKLAIDPRFIPLIERSWEEDWPSVYGRFDLAYDGVSAPKMLEYNADTPTSLLEAAVIQWYWLQDYDQAKDQFNSIHERLIEHWRYLRPYLHEGGVHFSAMQSSIEDAITTQYLRDTAEQAGLQYRRSRLGCAERRVGRHRGSLDRQRLQALSLGVDGEGRIRRQLARPAQQCILARASI
jgi:glutathionylspermidine synthase